MNTICTHIVRGRSGFAKIAVLYCAMIVGSSNIARAQCLDYHAWPTNSVTFSANPICPGVPVTIYSQLANLSVCLGTRVPSARVNWYIDGVLVASTPFDACNLTRLTWTFSPGAHNVLASFPGKVWFEGCNAYTVNASKGNVNINTGGAPIGDIGIPVSGCSASTLSNINVTLGASAVNYSSVLWRSSGTGTFTNANSLTAATYKPSVADSIAGSVNLTMTANGVCSGTASSSKILPIGRPVTNSTSINAYQGLSVPLSGNPSGGTFSVSSSNAFIAGGNILSITDVDTVKYSYTAPNGCVADEMLPQRDYGNLPGTWPVARATVLRTNAAWLGVISATTEDATKTTDPADGFSISGAAGSGSQANPFLLVHGFTYNFNVKVNGSGSSKPVYWAVWYDANGDGDFTDPADIFQSGVTSHNGPVNATPFSVSIPAGTFTNGTIRVAASAVNAGFTKAMNGTVSIGNGEIEDFYVSYDNAISLPLSLTSFTAAKQSSRSVLSWTTSSEENTQNFILERSTNGNNYLSIGIIAAAGNSSVTLHYNFTDNNPAAGANYYRLKMTDIDDKFTYSPIRLLNFGDGVKVIAVFPNPIVDILTITGAEAGMDLRLINSNGQQLMQVRTTGNTMQLDISKFSSGLYVLQVSAKGELIKNIKVLKQ
ncbi:MAG: T9SS type A sorting domain-containing protein [Chitinophagaceae bacterium]